MNQKLVNINHKITVYVVTYNRFEYLIKTIDSILKQEYRDFNLIILDNSSTDSNYDTLINQDHLTYIRHEKNIGGISNINYAFNNVSTEYFVVFHDDDIMDYRMLLTQFKFLESHPDISAVSTRAQLIDEWDNYINKSGFDYNGDSEYKVYSDLEYLHSYLGGISTMICPSVMYRSSFYKDKKLSYEIEAGQAADQFLWFQTLRYGGKIAVINKKLILYRIHQKQDSSINSLTIDINLLAYMNSIPYYNMYLSKISTQFRNLLIKKLILYTYYSNYNNSKNMYNKLITIFNSKFIKCIIFIVYNFTRFFKIFKKKDVKNE